MNNQSQPNCPTQPVGKRRAENFGCICLNPDSATPSGENQATIRSRQQFQGRAARVFVNIPMPLAAALDIQAGERVRWQLLDGSDLRLVRLMAPTPARGLKK